MSVNNVMIAAASVQRQGCIVRLPIKSDSKRGALARPLGRSAAAAVTRSTGRCLSTCGHRNSHIIWILQQDLSKSKELYSDSSIPSHLGARTGQVFGVPLINTTRT